MLRIHPNKLFGELSAPPSKSELHRALICAALADLPTNICGSFSRLGDDIRATCGAIAAMGCRIDYSASCLEVEPRLIQNNIVLDMRESGSSLRFLLPVIGALSWQNKCVKFTGCGRLPERPIADLLRCMAANGCSFSNEKLPLELFGILEPGEYIIPGNVSSQFISGLMFALPLLPCASTIVPTTHLESENYIHITRRMLSRFGIEIFQNGDEWYIPGSQRYHSPGAFTYDCGVHSIASGEVTIGGDWSNAAVWLACGAISGRISVKNLSGNSFQGDSAIVQYLSQFGADVEYSDGAVTVSRSQLNGIELNMGNTPDLFPVLAIVAAAAEGTTKFRNLARLRMKESDRLEGTAELLRALGGRVVEYEDGLDVIGTGTLRGGACTVAGDHRLVMAATLASTIADSDVIIDSESAVSKSYPEFFEVFYLLGGRFDAK